MAGRLTSTVSRSLISTVRNSSLRPPSPFRPPPFSSPRLRPPRLSRVFGELGCTQSFLPLDATTPCLTARLSTGMRAFSELYHGKNGEDG